MQLCKSVEMAMKAIVYARVPSFLTFLKCYYIKKTKKKTMNENNKRNWLIRGADAVKKADPK